MNCFVKPSPYFSPLAPVVLCFLICLSANNSPTVFAQEVKEVAREQLSASNTRPPIPLSQILAALTTEKITKDGVERVVTPAERINAVLSGVQARGVAFLYKPNVEAQLREAGATQPVLDAIRRAAAKLQNDEIKIHNIGVLYLERGDTAKAKQDYPDAIDNYNQAIELNPNNETAYNQRGNTYKATAVSFYNQKNYEEANKNYDKAIADYTEVLRIDPTNKVGYYNRGLCYIEKHSNNNRETAFANFDKAIADFKKILEIDPKDKRAHNKLVEVYKFKGQPEMAEAELKRFKDLNAATTTATP